MIFGSKNFPALRSIKSGFLVAWIPAIGSGLAYFFEFGYVGFFGIPASLIRIDITRILSGCFAAVIATTLYLMAVSAFADLAVGRHLVTRAIGRALVFASIGLPIYVLAPTVEHWWKPFVFMAIVALMFNLIAAIFHKARGLRYWERVDVTSVLEAEPIEPPKTMRHAVGDYVLRPVSVLLAVCGFVVLLGNYYASNKISHWVMAERSDVVLVATYGDVAVFKEYDPQTRKIGDKVLIRKFSDSSQIELRHIKTDKLLSNP
jgi:hypothetical protein